MKYIIKPLIIMLPLALSSCLPTGKDKTSSGDTSLNPSVSQVSGSNQSASISNSSGDISSSSIDPTDDSKIESISLDVTSIEIEVGKTSHTPIVNFVFNVPEEEVDKTVYWSLSNESIGTVDQYGRITAKASGKSTLICTTKEGGKKAFANVYTYPQGGSLTKKWKRIVDDLDLAPGDELIIACPQYDVAAGEDCSGMYLHPENVSYSSDKSEITNPGDAAQFILGDDYKGRDGYTLQVPEREDGTYLATTNTSKVSFFDSAKASSNLWDISYDKVENCWDIRSATNIDGWFMYNVSDHKFTTYKSNEVEYAMYVVSLYRLTIDM